MDGAYEQFIDELDGLITRWRGKRADDRISVGQMVGALTVAAHNVMADQRAAAEQDEEDSEK
jgi:hypothetical protein